MTASFAAYASQFLNRQQGAASESSSSQPLFYSFTTDNGSRAGDDSALAIDEEDELGDEDDPHLRHSNDYLSSMNPYNDPEEEYEDEDPYLRLDEEDPPLSRTARLGAASMPLIASEAGEQSQGWLAHQTSPSNDTTPSYLPPEDSDSDSGVSPPDEYTAATTSRHISRTPPPPPRTQKSNQLTQSLLPRDGVSRPVDVFSLPDPRHPPRRRRGSRRDNHWMIAWLACLSVCIIGSFIILFTTSTRRAPKGTVIPYTTLLHTIPLVTLLTFLSAVVSYAHIMLLKVFVKPVIFATSVFIPAALLVSAIWAFVGSFMWEEGSDPTWGETVGLRLFSLVPLILAFITSRNLVHLPEEIHSTSSILNLSTELLIQNPFLLALSPLILLVSLLVSIPFLTLAFRLLLVGYFTATVGTAWEWHIRNWAGWAIAGTVSVWLWSWGVARGVLRTTCAGVIGAWYFHSPDDPIRPPLDTYTVHAALTRSTDGSLGSIALSALLLTVVRLITLLTAGLRRYTPVPFLPWVAVPIRMLGNASGALSALALVYVGLTGDPFMTSARRAQVLSAGIHGGTGGGRVRYRSKGIDPSLSLLTVTPLTLTLPFALTAYLFVAHTLGAPGYAPVAALLAGGVTALVGMFCVGLVEDTADTLYMCYCIDRDMGIVRRKEVNSAFEWITSGHHPLSRAHPAPPAPIPAPVAPIATPSHLDTQWTRSTTLFSAPSPSPTDSEPELRAAADYDDRPPLDYMYEHQSPPPRPTNVPDTSTSQSLQQSTMITSEMMARGLSPPPHRHVEEDEEENSESMMMLGLEL